MAVVVVEDSAEAGEEEGEEILEVAEGEEEEEEIEVSKIMVHLRKLWNLVYMSTLVKMT